jgi:plastocyanin
MTSGKARLVLVMLLTAVLVISFATLSCGGGSKKSQTPTPPPSAATNTPMVMPTGTPAALTPTQTPSTPQAQQASVQIKDFEFAPSKVTIKVGGTVTWTNEGASAHTVTADDGSFDSGQLQKGKTFSRTFDSTGTFSYHCSIHSSMKAQVVVEE